MNLNNLMPRRDLIVLIGAIACGVFAFAMTHDFLKKSSRSSEPAAAAAPQMASEPALPAGMNSLTLSRGEIENLPSMIKADTFVDVMGLSPDVEGKMTFQSIVRNARVMSVAKSGDEAGSVTLALSPSAGEAVSQAAVEGKLRLILRPEAGRESILLGGIGFTEIIRGVEREQKMHFGGRKYARRDEESYS